MPGFLRWSLPLMIAVAGSRGATAQTPAAEPSIIPRPAKLTTQSGRFLLTGRTVIWTDAESAALGRQLARYLEPATGYALAVRQGGTPAGNRIVLRRDKSLKRLGQEGYALSVRPGVVTVRAPAAAGLFYGIQTIRQLLPPEIFREAPMTGERWTLPGVTIEDEQRFLWRGAHLDVVRHFMPKEFVKKYIDLLALQKMNSFHWHLTDDQGWRIQIRKYPRLTAVGAWRNETLVGAYTSDTSKQVFDHEIHGGFYTQEDIREIVAYARARFVNVVPEIEMPGHAQAAIAAYPWLGNAGDSLRVWTIWGVSQNILNPSDSTVAFMKDVLTEVMELFPGPYIHVGGDEAAKGQWKSTAAVQARIQALGLRNEDEMQSWFIRQMDDFLTAHGRRMIGWDEILEGGLAPNAAVMSWRGISGGIAAARAGHDVVMAPGSYTYLDHYQALDHTREPLAIGGFLPLDTVYSYDPMPAELEPRFAKHVLGAQGQVWTEYIKGPKNVEYMAYPRMSALAEVLWTPLGRKDYANFLLRLTEQLQRLDALDVNYRHLGGDGG
jgi:hexosaminidase